MIERSCETTELLRICNVQARWWLGCVHAIAFTPFRSWLQTLDSHLRPFTLNFQDRQDTELVPCTMAFCPRKVKTVPNNGACVLLHNSMGKISHQHHYALILIQRIQQGATVSQDCSKFQLFRTELIRHVRKSLIFAPRVQRYCTHIAITIHDILERWASPLRCDVV